MSEKLLQKDIERVQQRIARIRQRAGKHAEQITQIPAIQTMNSYRFAALPLFAAKQKAQQAHPAGWWGLVAVLLGWYFAQPHAVQELWQKLLGYWHAWRNPQDSDPESPAD